MLKEFFKKVKWEVLLTALFAITIGILFVCLPESSSDVLCTVVGIIFLALGCAFLVRYIMSGFWLVGGMLLFSVVFIMGGIFCLTQPEIVKSILTVVFGLFLIIDGLSKVQDGVYCARDKVKGWWVLVLDAILMVVLGAIVMFGTFEYVMIFAGISLIVDGVCDIVLTLTFSSRVKKVEKEIKQSYIDITNDEN